MKLALFRILTIAALTLGGTGGCMTSNMLEARKIPSIETVNDSQKTTQKIRCVAVLINGLSIPTELNYNLDKSIERHLLVRINQVFSARQTRILADRLHLDLTHPADRRQFASRTACSHTLEVTVTFANTAFMVVWAHRSLGLKARLTALSDSETIWQANQESHQGDGGVPISLTSLPFAISRAIHVHNDPMGAAKITEKTVLDLLRTLPDFRDKPKILPSPLG
ncbi:MAG: hypothetical protein VW124_09825 [Paracoccaceae bacterium]